MGGEQVGQLPKEFIVFPGKENSHNHQTDQPAMKGHSPVPDRELQRVLKIHPEVVENHIPEPGADRPSR